MSLNLILVALQLVVSTNLDLLTKINILTILAAKPSRFRFFLCQCHQNCLLDHSQRCLICHHLLELADVAKDAKKKKSNCINLLGQS